MGVNINIRRDIITQNSSRIGKERRKKVSFINKPNKKRCFKSAKKKNMMIIMDSYESVLNEDLWVEIFVRLPVESVYKFMAVSKEWSDLLSNRVFLNRVSKRLDNGSPWSILFNKDDDDKGLSLVNPRIHSRFFEKHIGFGFKFLIDEFKDTNLYFLGSSNGLVLCSTKGVQRSYFVCNPLTRRWVLIPKLLSANKNVVHGFLCESLSFSSASYKVFRILLCRQQTFHIEIFSSDSGEWEVHRVKCSGEVTFEPIVLCSVIVHNGVLYWTESRLHRIIAYEFIRNYESKIGECRFICFPADRGDNDYHCRRCFCVSQGLICYAQVQQRRQTLSVWVLEDSGGEYFWNLLQNIDFQDMFVEKDGEPMNLRAMVDFTRPVAFDPADRNVVILDCDIFILAYNIQTRKSEMLNCPSSLNNRSVIYKNSEVFPFGIVPRPTTVPSPSWANANCD